MILKPLLIAESVGAVYTVLDAISMIITVSSLRADGWG
jgi:hypothetical protein